MRCLFIIIALLTPLLGCVIHDRTYYTVYTPVIRLTNSSPAVPQAVMSAPQHTNKLSGMISPEATSGISAKRSL